MTFHPAGQTRMGTDYYSEILPESHYDEWLKFVIASPEGSIYAVPQYLAALSRADRGRVTVVGVRFGDELVGGAALYEKDSRYGSYVSPRPLLYYNGVLLRRYDTRYPSERTARHLKTLKVLESALSCRAHTHLTLASPSSMTDARTFMAAGWHVKPRYTYVVDVSDLVSLWTRMEQNLRRLVKRCERESITFHEEGDFDAFFRLHGSIMRQRDQRHYLPEAAFRRFFQELRAASLCRLYESRTSAGRVIASQLVLLGPNPVCHVAAAATDQEFHRSGVSAFMRWKSFEALSALGYSGVDLTDAALNPVSHFKSQLGGELRMTLLLDAPRSLAYRMISGIKDLLMRARSRLPSGRSHR
jgi:hypothetical protein